MNHYIVIGSWGRDPVVVCRTCANEENENGLVLLRSRGVEIPLLEVMAAIEKHIGQEASRPAVAGEPVPGAIDLGAEEETDLVAYGEPEAFPEGYHPRTGQKLEVTPDQPVPFRVTDGGPSLREYLESKGEM